MEVAEPKTSDGATVEKRLAPAIVLNNKQVMPVIGLGTFRALNQECEEAVRQAIDVGYRLFDTAYIYENEAAVGRAIKSKIDNGVILRKDIFVVSKLADVYHEPKRVEHACHLSLDQLELKYLDLYLMHCPVGMVYTNDNEFHGNKGPNNIDYVDTWLAMEKLVTLGLVRSIGLSNFNAEQVERVLEHCNIKPVVNQIECHPGFNQSLFIEFLSARNIIVMAYMPLMRPKPEKQHPPFMFDATAQSLAKKYDRTPAQICLRYLIQCHTIPIPKSTSAFHIAENFGALGFELSDGDMQLMDKYHTGERIIKFMHLAKHKYYPFKGEI